jgi:predicted TIM-barrel fold metal-dependent hydrolase
MSVSEESDPGSEHGNALGEAFPGYGPPTVRIDWSRWKALPLREFRPRPAMRRAHTEVPRPRVPAVDVHNHLGRWLTDGRAWMVPSVDALVQRMDDLGVQRIVNLDGRWGEELQANLDRYDRRHPDRFATFCHADWRGLDRSGDSLVRELDRSVALGARGLKIWKDLGLGVRDDEGTLVLPDDPRVVRLVRRAGEHGIPVLIHTADPVAFFDPVDQHNERLEELAAQPHWWFGDTGRYPTFERLMNALESLVAQAPETNVIGAHVGCNAEDLAWVAQMMASHANFHIDLGGRLGEIGRQPRAFGRLVAAHPDRVLFGTDCFPPDETAFRSVYRFLETDDEHWPYGGERDGCPTPTQGRWAISGVGLEERYLRMIYRDNAERLGL